MSKFSTSIPTFFIYRVPPPPPGARRHNPYFWKLPRPNQSWFEIHYNDRRIPGDYFRKQLRMNRCTFDILLNVLRLAVTCENTRLRDCIAPEKVLALGLYRLAHGNLACSRLSISGSVRSERKQRRAKNQAIQGERAGARGPDPPHFFLACPPPGTG